MVRKWGYLFRKFFKEIYKAKGRREMGLVWREMGLVGRKILKVKESLVVLFIYLFR